MQKIIWIPTNIVLRFFGRMQVHGLEHIKDLKGPVIFACNHSSELDPFFVPAILPFFSRLSPIFYTSREKSFYKGSGWRQFFYGGLFFKAWGSYPVMAGLHDYEMALSTHIDIARHGGSLCIFPEGGITKDGSIGQAKGGVAYLSYTTGAVIVPVRIRDSYKITPAELFSRKRKFIVSFGRPMNASSDLGMLPTTDDFKAYANKVMDVVRGM